MDDVTSPAAAADKQVMTSRGRRPITAQHGGHRYPSTDCIDAIRQAIFGKAEIPREQFPRVAFSQHPREILAKMSLTCQELIGRVGRGCYEDANDLSATSRACRARGIWRTTRHTDKRAALYTAADRRPTNQVSAWQAKRGSRPTRATFSQHPREDVARVGRVREDVTRMLRGNCSSGILA